MTRAESRASEAARCSHWLAALDTGKVRFLILDAETDRTLLDAARAHPGWTVDYDDGESVLLARSLPDSISQQAA